MKATMSPELLRALGLEANADSAEVDAAWQGLPMETREAILAIVKACEIVLDKSQSHPL
jgi:hypothetical protein